MSRAPILTALRDNVALGLGVALPLVLMTAFFVAGRMTVAGTDPPAYDVVFAANYDPQWTNQPWRLTVVDGALVIRFVPDEGTDPRFFVQPTVYRWDHETGHAAPLDIDFDNVVDGTVEAPALDRLNTDRLLPNALSPDGYRLEYDSRPGGGGLLADIIGFARYRTVYTLTKGSRRVAVEGSDPFYQARFVAWVQE